VWQRSASSPSPTGKRAAIAPTGGASSPPDFQAETDFLKIFKLKPIFKDLPAETDFLRFSS
jgi:hypothetical protein